MITCPSDILKYTHILNTCEEKIRGKYFSELKLTFFRNAYKTRKEKQYFPFHKILLFSDISCFAHHFHWIVSPIFITQPCEAVMNNSAGDERCCWRSHRFCIYAFKCVLRNEAWNSILQLNHCQRIIFYHISIRATIMCILLYMDI